MSEEARNKPKRTLDSLETDLESLVRKTDLALSMILKVAEAVNVPPAELRELRGELGVVLEPPAPVEIGDDESELSIFHQEFWGKVLSKSPTAPSSHFAAFSNLMHSRYKIAENRADRHQKLRLALEEYFDDSDPFADQPTQGTKDYLKAIKNPVSIKIGSQTMLQLSKFALNEFEKASRKE